MMPADMIASLIAFTLVSGFTPGPNNIMLAASGVNFGFVRTLPHIAGILVGFGILILAVGLGLGSLFLAMPQLQIALKIAGALYLVWLAWKIARAGEISPGQTRPEPLTFAQALSFQAVNPKGWVISISTISLYVRPGHLPADLAMTFVLLTLGGVASATSWAGFGSALREALKKPARIRVFNTTIAVLLVASIIPMVRA